VFAPINAWVVSVAVIALPLSAIAPRGGSFLGFDQYG